MAQHSSGAAITIQRVNAQQPGRLELVSEAVGDDGRIADLYSAYHDGVSPALAWTGMPDAQSFVLVVEDPDAPTERPFLHWALWNIPGLLESLPAGIRNAPTLDELDGMVQGRNSANRFGYMGPKPPPGDGPHRYHFQLFALDLSLDLPPSAPLEALVERLKAHTIASAELVGTYEQGDRQPAASRPSERSFASGEDRGGLDTDDPDRHAPHDEDGVVRPEA